MADMVQFRLERMTDELDDLERRGLFTRAELADVVHRLRDFESRLRRHSWLCQDFLDYIAYELRLDSLRDLRKRAIIRAADAAAADDEKPTDDGGDEEDGAKKSKKRPKKWKKSISDIAGVLRVLDIYRMATTRFKGDLDLWFRYLEFCRGKRHGRMKQAAAWEFDQDLNVAAASALMQSGLRSCPQSEDMWIEYLRMELTYLNKLKARKVALGEDVKTLQKNDSDAGQWKQENKELFMPLNEQVGDPKDPGSDGVSTQEKEDLFWQQGLLIIQTIYRGVVEALPSGFTLRKKFLEILNSVDLAHSDELKLEDYWDWFPRLQLGNLNNSGNTDISTKEATSNKLNRSIQVYDEAVRRLTTSKMYSLYANFWMDVLNPDREGDSMALFQDSEFDASEFTSSMLKVYEKAESCGYLTEDLSCQYVSLCLKLERFGEAKNLAEKLCDGPLSSAAKLWSLRASMEINSAAITSGSSSLSKEKFSSLFYLFCTVLSKLSVNETEELWHMKLVKCAMLSLSLASGSDSGASVSSAIVGWYLQMDGMKQARKMYKRFLALPCPSLKFLQYRIELESNLASLGDHGALTNARRLYDSATDMYPQERQVWRNYYNLELKVGTSETANAVYCRARKVLGDTTALTTSHS
ncbi:hypothetical protein BS78_K286800 [Paspalum vaginatum]|uniref:Suppressor of forked domain-containing protein n=1 Tax=Paspalum vaginatum TaxID=158149 RepID=A0A9W7XBA7_9POAL|nr:hypothetical protein BS78_K286800 [Paspalum vaginatum]